MAQSRTQISRPMSPHLTVYKFTLTMMMSIMHRVTGAALYFGIVLLVAWLFAAALGEPAYGWVQWLYGSILGQLVLFGFTWSIYQHMSGGIRHFIWDFGVMLDHEGREFLVTASWIGSFGLAVLTWIIAYVV